MTDSNIIKNAKAKVACMFIYFSELMDRPVLDASGRQVGEVYDIVVRPTEVYPHSHSLIIRKGFPNRTYAVIPWEDIIDMESKDIRLKTEAAKIVFTERHDNKEELTLRRDILDQQVVDTYNHKVIRVNDVHLLKVEHALMLAHVDIGTRGIFRRLGFEKPVDLFVKIFKPGAVYLQREYLISWKYIQPLSINPASMTIKVSVPQNQIGNIPAADLGEIFLDLDIRQKVALFKSLNVANRAKIFINIDLKSQKSLIEDLQLKEVAELLAAVPSDEATDFLEKLPKASVNELLAIMESKQSRKLSQLLGYSSDSAGGLMTTEYLAFTKDISIENVIAQIKERTFKSEPPPAIYIVDEGHHLIGATNFRRLVMTDPKEPIAKAAFPKTYFVTVDSGVKEVAYLMEKYKYYVIPVVDEHNALQGIITVDDVLGQLITIAWRRLKKIKVLPKQNLGAAPSAGTVPSMGENASGDQKRSGS